MPPGERVGYVGAGFEPAIEIGENEYDNVFVVIRGTPARLLRLRFE